MQYDAWWHKRVIYQIYPRSFYDSNGDGIGDIQGVITKLDYLKDLGIGAIWFSPMYKSPQADNGYDISDYRDIHPDYGTMDDMKQLIEQCHNRDIKVVLDLVINHTSDEHEWFKQSINPNSPYHQYYVWKKGRKILGKEYPPNNWTSQFTGPAWSKNEQNGLYYLRVFTEKQADLNYHHPPLKEEMKQMMRFWLDLGVDGFRCDVINMIYKTSYKNGRIRILNIGEEHYLSQPGSHKILHEFYQDVWHPYHAFTVGETVRLNKKQVKEYTNEQLETVFQFDHTLIDQHSIPVFKKKYYPQKMRKTLMKWQKQVDWNTLFFENHDVPRSVSRFGDEKQYYQLSAKMLAMVVLTLRGTPFIYQGQEIGQINTPFTSIDQIDDVISRNVYQLTRRLLFPKKLAFKLTSNICRDHARTPMTWSDQLNGGFSQGKPWLMVSPNYQRINVASNQKDNQSILAFYKQIIAYRNESLALQIGNIEFTNLGKQILSFTRTLQQQQLKVIINLSKNKVRLKQPITGEVLLTNSNYQNLVNLKVLGPYEGLIIK